MTISLCSQRPANCCTVKLLLLNSAIHFPGVIVELS